MTRTSPPADHTLGAALERGHRDIDGGIEAFLGQSDDGERDDELLVRAMTGLRRHIYLEEEFLFPPLRGAGMTMPIFVMVREHGTLWLAMDALTVLLGTSADRDKVRGGCRDLLTLLDAHNSKEEPVIYTQADRILTAEASDELRSFLARGVIPDGWVCARAAA